MNLINRRVCRPKLSPILWPGYLDGRSLNYDTEWPWIDLHEDEDDAEKGGNDADPAIQDAEERFVVTDVVVGNHGLHMRALPGMRGALVPRFVVVCRCVSSVGYRPGCVGSRWGRTPAIAAAASCRSHGCRKSKQKQDRTGQPDMLLALELTQHCPRGY